MVACVIEDMFPMIFDTVLVEVIVLLSRVYASCQNFFIFSLGTRRVIVTVSTTMPKNTNFWVGLSSGLFWWTMNPRFSSRYVITVMCCTASASGL